MYLRKKLMQLICLIKKQNELLIFLFNKQIIMKNNILNYDHSFYILHSYLFIILGFFNAFQIMNQNKFIVFDITILFRILYQSNFVNCNKTTKEQGT